MSHQKIQVTQTKIDGMSVIYSSDIFLPYSETDTNEVELTFNVNYKIKITIRKVTENNTSRIKLDDNKTVDGESMGFIINYNESDSGFGIAGEPLHIFTRTTTRDGNESKEKISMSFVLEKLINKSMVLRVMILSKELK